MTGHSLRAAISTACDLTNPRLSEVDWDEVAAAFNRLRSDPQPDSQTTTPRPEALTALDILDVIDGIVDDTHPEGDGCPLCVALDDLREALAADAPVVFADERHTTTDAQLRAARAASQPLTAADQPDWVIRPGLLLAESLRAIERAMEGAPEPEVETWGRASLRERIGDRRAYLTRSPKFGPAIWLGRRFVARLSATVEDSRTTPEEPEPRWKRDAMVFVDAVNAAMTTAVPRWERDARALVEAANRGAALAATATERPLDVERLARAVRAISPWKDDEAFLDVWANEARAIAAEYAAARLTEGGEPG